MEKLFRRQFIMGVIEENEFLKNFQKINLGKISLYAHKDLALTKVCKDDRVLVLLGFLIDPRDYRASDREILEKILSETENFAGVLEKSTYLGGRWVLIYKDKDEFKLFNDPCGVRQVHYASNNGLIGSNPAIIDFISPIEKRDDEAYKEYINSKFYQINEMEWYSDKTSYKNIKKLLANTYINLKNLEVSHFWVDIDKKSYEENIKIVSKLLTDELRGIALRDSKKIQSLTAGYDSRVIYAASKAAGCDFDFFLSTMNIMGKDHPDIKIAKNILDYYDTELTIIDCLDDFDDDFINLYKRSIAGAKVLPKTLTIQHFYKKNQDYIHISGNNSAVFKSYYENSDPKSGKDIARLVGIPKNLKIFNDDFDKWVKNRKDLARDKNIDLMKLFYWEMRMPNWGSQYQQEADLAMEEFAPFNNREIMLRLLDLANDKDYTEVFDDIIKTLDPKLLDFPINPRNKKEKMMDLVKKNVSKRSWERIKIILKK